MIMCSIVEAGKIWAKELLYMALSSLAWTLSAPYLLLFNVYAYPENPKSASL
jgi:hypothetical protein